MLPGVAAFQGVGSLGGPTRLHIPYSGSNSPSPYRDVIGAGRDQSPIWPHTD